MILSILPHRLAIAPLALLSAFCLIITGWAFPLRAQSMPNATATPTSPAIPESAAAPAPPSQAGLADPNVQNPNVQNPIVPPPSSNLGILPTQDGSTDEMPPEVKILKSIESEIREKYKTQIYERSQIPSLFFNPPQYALLREARIGFNTRIPTLQDLRDPANRENKGEKAAEIIRRLTLLGILYTNDRGWVIYFNNQRLTPKNLPEDIADINVTGEYIDLVWYDQLTNQPVSLRLRPGQTFDLDKKSFLSNYIKIEDSQNGLDQGRKDEAE